MYTRCPECETTFKVGADDLRRAQGKVRCGDCEHVFNAVEYLMEEAPAEDEQPPVLSRAEEIVTSADNPHREDSFLEPANETGISEAPVFTNQDDGYELEIKAYDEKTGEAWSPLDVSNWETSTESTSAEDSDNDEHDAPVAYADSAAEPDAPATPPATEPTAANDETPFSEDVPVWLQDSSDALDSEQAFHDESDTHTGLDSFGAVTDDNDDSAHLTNAATGADIEVEASLEDEAGDAAPEHEIVDIDVSEVVDLIEPASAADEAATDEADADEAEEAEEAEEADTDASGAAIDATIFGMSQTVEMEPIPDTEGLPTVEMPLSVIAGTASNEAEVADEPEPTASQEVLYDDFTGIEDEADTDEPAAEFGVELPADSTPDETDAEADDEAEDTADASGLEAADFDDTIWESIPGVGAAEAEREDTQIDVEDELRGGLSYTDTHLFGGDEDDEDDESDSDLPFIEAGSFADGVQDEDDLSHEPGQDEDGLSPELGQDEDGLSHELGQDEDGLSHELGQDEAEEIDSGLPVIEADSFAAAETEAEAAEPAAWDEATPDTEAGELPVIEADSNTAEPADAEEDTDEEPAGQAQDDNLDFNVPEDKWSTFFGTASKPPIFNKPVAVETEYEGEELDGAFESNADLSAEPADAAEVSPDEPEAAEELVAEMNEAFGKTTEDAEEPWHEMEPVEEVVMATGEFGATEISSSLEEDEAGNSGRYKTYQDDEWKPNEWQPAAESDQPSEWQPEYLDPQAPVDTPSRKGVWTGIIVLLAIGFATQLVHYNRDKLAASASWGETVRNVYGKAGVSLYPTWPMDSYEIRGSEAVAGESGPDVLDIRTQIASVTDTPVGLPHLRVILRDRWSNPVAARNFAPAEYAKADTLPANGLLQPNQTIGAHVSIVDPGSGAQGFELEICVPRRDTGLECTGQPFK